VVSLLDVNCLIALLDLDHVHHTTMERWFRANSGAGWSTCPITENGLVRVMSLPKYPSGRRSPRQIIERLQMLKTGYSSTHHFWPDEVSLTDATLFRPDYITGSLNVTDAYLLGVAAKHASRFVSFDRSLPWQAIRNGSARLIESPLLQ
jgi:toxin-antitoxin system PIN domain toxin